MHNRYDICVFGKLSKEGWRFWHSSPPFLLWRNRVFGNAPRGCMVSIVPRVRCSMADCCRRGRRSQAAVTRVAERKYFKAASCQGIGHCSGLRNSLNMYLICINAMAGATLPQNRGCFSCTVGGMDASTEDVFSINALQTDSVCYL